MVVLEPCYAWKGVPKIYSSEVDMKALGVTDLFSKSLKHFE